MIKKMNKLKVYIITQIILFMLTYLVGWFVTLDYLYITTVFEDEISRLAFIYIHVILLFLNAVVVGALEDLKIVNK